MKNLFPILIFLTAVLLTSCGKSEPKTNSQETDTPAVKTTTAAEDIDYDAMATELCTCMGPMMDFQNKLMALMAAGNEDGIMALQEEAMGIQQGGEECVKALEEKYGLIEGPEMEEKATESLRKVCPDFMAMMEGGPEPGMMDDLSEEELEKLLEEAQEAGQ